MKLTEDQTVELMMKHLQKDGWQITNFCLGQKRGYDIVAEKGGETMRVEVKGAMANLYSPTKRRKHFDSGQIKSHFGRALVKTMETIELFPDDIAAIAHPDDVDIRRAIGELVPQLQSLGIKHYWIYNFFIWKHWNWNSYGYTI